MTRFSASAIRRRNSADLPPSVAARAEKLAATSSGTRSEIRAIGSNPNHDVIHRWREAYPALENAALENAETPSAESPSAVLVRTNIL
jgi:hypothetical protein